MFGSLLSIASVGLETKVQQTRNWWHIMRKWYPNMHEIVYCVPPVHFHAVSYKPKAEEPVFEEPYERFGMRMILPTQGSNIRDDEAQQRVLHTFSTFARKKGFVAFILSNVEFQNYLNKDYEFTDGEQDFPRPNIADNEGEIDVLIIDKENGIFVLEVKATGLKSHREHVTDETQVTECIAPLCKASRQLPKDAHVVKHILSDLDPHGHIKIRRGVLMPNLKRAVLKTVLDRFPLVSQDFMSAIGVCSVEEVQACCLCADEMPPKDTGTTESIARDVLENVEHFWEALIKASGEQIELLQLEEDFVHIEGPPGTGKTLMLLLRILTWLDGNNLVYLLSLSPPSRSIIHVLHEQVRKMLYEHKDKAEADVILKKKLRIFVMTRPEHTIDDKYFERRLHKWRSRAKLKDSERNWGYPRPPTLPPVAPMTDKKLCLVLDETGVNGKGLEAFFNQIAVCHMEACFTSAEFTAGLSVWSASSEMCGRPVYARDPHKPRTEKQFGICWKLSMPLRCPPTIQRTLMLVQPCLDLKNVFAYEKDSILPHPIDPAIAASESKFQYHADGLPVHLIAHGSHKKADQDIWFCAECGAHLAEFLKGTLRIGDTQPVVTDLPLLFKDVLIVATHKAFDKSLPIGGFFLSMHKRGLKVAVNTIREEGDAALSPEDIILVANITAIHGLERAVVVVIPEHPNQVTGDTTGGKSDVAMEVQGCQAQLHSSAAVALEDKLTTQTSGEKADVEMVEYQDHSNSSEEKHPRAELQHVECWADSGRIQTVQSTSVEGDGESMLVREESSGQSADTESGSERRIEAALQTLTEEARKDVFYIGSRAGVLFIMAENSKPEIEKDEDQDSEEEKSDKITTRDVAPMFGSLLTVAQANCYTRARLTSNWWHIIRKWYPDMHHTTYCVPPVHFYHVTYKPKEEQPIHEEPYERFGMRMLLPIPYSDVVDDEAQQRVLQTFLTFAKKKNFLFFILSNVEFQNYLNKTYDVDPGVTDLPKLTNNDEGEVDVLVIDKSKGIFVLEIKGTGYRSDFTIADCMNPLIKITKQLPKDARVVKKVLSDLDPQQKIKIRKGFLMPNLTKKVLREALEKYPTIEEDLRKGVGFKDIDQIVNSCLCSDDMPPKNTDPAETMTPNIVEKIAKFWDTLQEVTGKMEEPIEDGVYEQIVARFCGHLTTVKIYTEKTMPRVRLEIIPPKPPPTKKKKQKNPKAIEPKQKLIPFECRTLAGAARELARRFSELVLLPDQIDLLQVEEDFVHIEGPPGTGKTLMLLLRILTWLDGNNLVYLLSLSPPSRSIIHVLHEQVRKMLYEHKDKAEADVILKKKLRIFVMTRPEHTIDDKYFERRLHKWRSRAKLKDSERNWGYPRPPTLPPVAPMTDKKLCLVLDETGMSGKGLQAFFDQVAVCHKEGCFTSSAEFTSGLSVWSASVEMCGRPVYARDPKEPKTEEQFGVFWKLRMPLRCPPTVQRALMLVQPDLDKKNEDMLPNPLQEQDPNDPKFFQYPADGLPVHLIAHGSHKKADQAIWFCAECGDNVANYLKNVLRIGSEDACVSDVPLGQRDVLIIATHNAFDKSLPVGAFFLSMHKGGLKVAVNTIREEGDAALSPEDIILVADITSVHGLERAVVVVIPEHPDFHPPEETVGTENGGDVEMADTQNGTATGITSTENRETAGVAPVDEEMLGPSPDITDKPHEEPMEDESTGAQVLTPSAADRKANLADRSATEPSGTTDGSSGFLRAIGTSCKIAKFGDSRFHYLKTANMVQPGFSLASSMAAPTQQQADWDPMFMTLLSVADADPARKQILSENWWHIIRKWYPDMHNNVYCVPPVHFFKAHFKEKRPEPEFQEPYERFGMRMLLPSQHTSIRDDEAQQRVLRTISAFARRKKLTAFILSNMEFQNYLNKSYNFDDPSVPDLPKPKMPDDEGEIDILKIIKQLGKADVVRKVLSDLDPNEKIKIRRGFVMANLDQEILWEAIDFHKALEDELKQVVGVSDLKDVLKTCLFRHDLPEEYTAGEATMSDEVFERVNAFWEFLQDKSGQMAEPMADQIYEQIVARFCGPLTTVKIYTEKTMPRVRLTKCPGKKGKGKQGKCKMIADEAPRLSEAARAMARRFSELVLLQEQVEVLQLDENFIHLEGPPGTGKTLLLLLRILTWLDVESNMVYILSLSPPSRSVIHVLHEQVKRMLYTHKMETEADKIIKKQLRQFIMTRPENTLDDKYFERKLHKWRLRSKLKDSDRDWGYPRPPTLPPVRPKSDKKLCLVLDETGLNNKNLCEAFFKQVSECYRDGCFTSGDFTAGLSVWSASVERIGRPVYARNLRQESRTAEKFGICWELKMPLRCPPTIQRALMFVQPSLDEKNDKIVPNPTTPNADPCIAAGSADREQYHADGLPVYLVAHGNHKKADEDIWFCRECGDDVGAFLKDKLKIGCDPEKEFPVTEVPLRYRDVMIVGTQGAFNKSLPVGGFLLGLKKKKLEVAVSAVRQEADIAMSPNDVILVADITSIHGLERAVIIVIPDHPNKPAQSDIVEGGGEMPMEVGGASQPPTAETEGATSKSPSCTPTSDCASFNIDVEMADEAATNATNKQCSAQMDTAELSTSDGGQGGDERPQIKDVCYAGDYSERCIKAAVDSLREESKQDIFYIGSRAVCQLILVHYGKVPEMTAANGEMASPTSSDKPCQMQCDQ
ncbi:hypothetical protein BaRGS_00016321 [Batillaria attramentaria]|uniref:Uncharacterized protein n=1 Tax=Batillaria attramentaria TaxID=370345 RepID=A0ABD0KZ66_9CAEN